MDRPPVYDTASALGQIVSRMESRCGATGRSDAAEVALLFASVGVPDERRVLDVGSGIGVTMQLIHLFGWAEVEGVEHNPRLALASRALFPERVVHVADAFGFDYTPYDLIYANTCDDPADQQRLEAIIKEQMRPGAVLLKR